LNSQVAAIGAAAHRGAVDEALHLFGTFNSAVQSLRKESDAVYVCFRSQRELNYFIASQPDLLKVRVLDWCVAWGMFLKAFALSKAGRFGEALQSVEEAAKLAPLYAHAQVERGYILNRLGRAQEALAAYARAWELVARLPENLESAGAALRGQAVALVELGDLDRAEKLLRDSLVVEPGNTVANNELTYIAHRRSGKP
jgi:tetratricopeptide (TPR) repeat protein